MKNEMYKHKCLGFTLAELLIVVAIIAVLVAVSVPIFANKTKHAKEVVCENNRKTLVHQIWYEKMGDDSFTKAQAEQLIKDSDAYCPTLGSDVDYTLEAFDEFIVAVTCPEHGTTGSGGGDITTTTGQKFLIDFQTFLNELKVPPQKIDNNTVRNAFFAKNGNKWPTLTVEGTTLYIQPFFKKNDKSDVPIEERTWLFASTNPNSTSVSWYVDYVFNTIDGKWYKRAKGISVTKYNSTTELNTDITSEQDSNGNPLWKAVTDYKEEW